MAQLKNFRIVWQNRDHKEIHIQESSVKMALAVLTVRVYLHTGDVFEIIEQAAGNHPIRYLARVRHRDIYYARVLKDGSLGKTRGNNLPYGYSFLP